MKRNFRCSGMCSMVIIKARPLKALASISIGKLYIANLKLFFSTLLLYYLLCIPDSRTLFSNLVFDPLFLYENKKPFYTVIKIIFLVILCRFSGIYFRKTIQSVSRKVSDWKTAKSDKWAVEIVVDSFYWIWTSI